MVRVRVKNINFGEKLLELKNGTVEELINVLGSNDDSVLLVDKTGEIYTRDRKIKEGAEINIIEVFSGG